MNLAGTTFLTPMQTTFAACATAAVIRIICIGVETFTHWVHDRFVYPVWDRLAERGWGLPPREQIPLLPPEPSYISFVPPRHWRFRCPVCGARVEHRLDVCWNCGYGADGDTTAFFRAIGQIPPT
jgi:hypothetical protein